MRSIVSILLARAAGELLEYLIYWWWYLCMAYNYHSILNIYKSKRESLSLSRGAVERIDDTHKYAETKSSSRQHGPISNRHGNKRRRQLMRSVRAWEAPARALASLLYIHPSLSLSLTAYITLYYIVSEGCCCCCASEFRVGFAAKER